MTLAKEEVGVVVGVREHDTPFLQYLNELKINLGTKIKVLQNIDFDHSKKVLINDTVEQILSDKVCTNLFVKRKSTS